MYHADNYHMGLNNHETAEDHSQIDALSTADPKVGVSLTPNHRNRSFAEDCRREQAGNITMWPNTQTGPAPAQCPTETADWGVTGIPVKWLEVSGFPRQANANILKSFHAVSRVERMRETPEGFRLRFFDRIGLYRALQLDGKRIEGYHVVVKPLLGDPLGFEPIVHPTKPQFPYMQESGIQRMVRTCSWKGKMQLINDFMFFLWFTFFMWCVMSIRRVQKWCHKAYHMNVNHIIFPRESFP